MRRCDTHYLVASLRVSLRPNDPPTEIYPEGVGGEAQRTLLLLWPY